MIFKKCKQLLKKIILLILQLGLQSPTLKKIGKKFVRKQGLLHRLAIWNGLMGPAWGMEHDGELTESAQIIYQNLVMIMQQQKDMQGQ